MLLKNLLPNHCDLDLEISSIEIDSRLVKKGSIFFAIQGKNLDGAKFIDSAFNNGAVAVICNANYDLSLLENAKNPAIIRVENVYQSLTEALQKFYSNLPKNILAITGTNGKTSVAYFINQMQELLGKKSALIGTIGVKTSNLEIQSKFTKSNLTTPDIVSLYQNLAILKENAIDDVAIEASSIGLEQQRLAGLNIGLGAFTNFTQDHLDYHQTMSAYFDCKMRLFREVLSKNAIAVLNADIYEFANIKEIALGSGLRVFSYSLKNKSINYENNNTHSALSSNEAENINFINHNPLFKKFSSEISFQDANILSAFLAVIAYYQPTQKQIELLIGNFNQLKPAEGRMQKVATLKNGSQIFIDYAHTPDALINVLTAAKQMPNRNVYLLFGCGGDRDQSKRPKMGKVASDLADFVIVSDDNPRTENAAEIRKQILASCNLLKTIPIANRKNAIFQAVAMLRDDEILIIAGKGHEKYQIIGDQKFEFDEEKIVKEAIDDREQYN